jgi:uncharacterized Ntn-hydrolase superfamily protein
VQLRSRFRPALLALLLLVAAPRAAHATWSIIAVDRTTGRIVVSSATCVPQGGFARFPAKGLMDVQAIIAPGFGVAAAQAGVDRTRSNQTLIFEELKKGTHPSAILAMLVTDTLIQTRQFGIVDLQGRFAGFSGGKNGVASNAVQGQVTGTQVYYSIQGNILASYAVVQNAVQAFERESGTLEDRVMAAMEAADAAGGDKRCSCASQPVPKTVAACTARTAHVAYLVAADSTSTNGASFNDGTYRMYFNVTDENTLPDEDPNPVRTLRLRYDAWRRAAR